MQELLKMLGEIRIPPFKPSEYGNHIHLLLKFVSGAVRMEADTITFEDGGKRSYSRQGEVILCERLSSRLDAFINPVSTWRKILEKDQEIARYFEVIEDVPGRIVCRIIDSGEPLTDGQVLID